jgi:urease accessory protein
MQRSQGEVRLAFKPGAGGRTALDELYQQGCLKARLPRQSAAAHEAVLINTAGGLTGGDDLRISLRMGAGTRAVVTTQACERIYKASSGSAHVSSSITVADGGTALWLPQETILFQGARLNRRMRVELSGTAGLVACEAIILGRPAMGEVVHNAHLLDEWVITLDGRSIFVDRLGLDGDVSAELDRTAVGNGARCFASVMTAGPDTAHQRDVVRDVIGASGLTGGASDLGKVMLARVLAPNSHQLKTALIPLLEALGETPLPRVWRM